MAEAESINEDDYISDYFSSDSEEEETQLDWNYSAKREPGYFQYECFSVEMTETFINKSVEELCEKLDIHPAQAKMYLHFNGWNFDGIVQRQDISFNNLVISSHRKAPLTHNQSSSHQSTHICQICTEEKCQPLISSNNCNHYFCRDCWDNHFQAQINRGLSTRIECMAISCNVYAPEDFVEQSLSSVISREIYQKSCFIDYVQSHPKLQFCPGQNCSVIFYAEEKVPKRVTCKDCNTSFCFSCSRDYHAPTNCDAIEKWWRNYDDEYATAKYISLNTRDCPKCLVRIERNGEDNHIFCVLCNYNFCWKCNEVLAEHGVDCESHDYENNPNIINERQTQDLFYFKRFENHKEILLLAEQARSKIQEQIHERVKDSTYWTYLLKAFDRLRECRYTLQYTYPFVYYLEKSTQKDLYEGWQAELEVDVENLSLKIEQADEEELGSLMHQMAIAEIRRKRLLKDFFETECYTTYTSLELS